jgi:Sec-independent protein translocase protein TatA
MFKLILELFLFYILFRFIFDLVIPVYRTTKQVKKHMSHMQEEMEKHHRDQSQQQSTSKRSSFSGNSKPSPDEYIDYEEVK